MTSPISRLGKRHLDRSVKPAPGRPAPSLAFRLAPLGSAPVDINDLFGIPAHPLFVHLPIVLVPLAAIGVIAMVVRPSLRPALGWITAGVLGLATLGLQLAMGSGEQLQERVPETALVRSHRQLAEQARPMVGLFFLAVAAWVWIDHRRRTRPEEAEPSHWVARAATPVMVAAVGLGVLSTVWVTRTGHEGARATWAKTPAATSEGGGEDGG